MRGLQTWNRREFTVTPNGYFTVLKASKWFSAVPLPGGFRYLIGQSQRNAGRQTVDGLPKPEQTDRGHANGQDIAALSQSTIPGPFDHRLVQVLMRAALIVLAAIVITFALLWFSGDCDTWIYLRP
jgi:hypothetical protein